MYSCGFELQSDFKSDLMLMELVFVNYFIMKIEKMQTCLNNYADGVKEKFNFLYRMS